jgi:DNA helicase II / ATP-dependent DNA helicase PcrA
LTSCKALAKQLAEWPGTIGEFSQMLDQEKIAYHDFEGEETFDLDAVDLLTVHQAKGLEWPVVFIPCLVNRRFPAVKTGQKEDWLLPESVFPSACQERYAGTMDDERRLFYVAMTRAKDMLYLSRFRRKKNRVQSSPFLEHAAGSDPPLVSSVPLPPRFVRDKNGTPAKLTLTFSDLARYEHCPLAFRMGGLLGFERQLVPELGYGKAIHHALRRIADHVRTTGNAPTQQEVDGLLDDEFYLPYAHSFLYQRLRTEARRVIDRYLSRYRDDLFRVWETERPFELHLDRAIVTGRADVILDREGGEIGSLALVDYKTAGDRIICHQSNIGEVVGTTRVVGYHLGSLILQANEGPFPRGIKMRDLRKIDQRIHDMDAFKPGLIRTLYPISDRDADYLLNRIKGFWGDADD